MLWYQIMNAVDIIGMHITREFNLSQLTDFLKLLLECQNKSEWMIYLPAVSTSYIAKRTTYSMNACQVKLGHSFKSAAINLSAQATQFFI